MGCLEESMIDDGAANAVDKTGTWRQVTERVGFHSTPSAGIVPQGVAGFLAVGPRRASPPTLVF